MPWKEFTHMSQRREFVSLAMDEGTNLRRLCRCYGIAPKTGYKWIQRFREGGVVALADRSRRPKTTPRRTLETIEQAILHVRQDHPAWGARKIRAYLQRKTALSLPAPSTITTILDRYGYLNPEEACKHRPWQRFVADAPNVLWQMDFKGDFPLPHGRCYPLTLLDDHSRFNLALRACPNQTEDIVQAELRSIFRRYGLPRTFLFDNGPPWGSANLGHPYTRLTTWLIRLGIRVSHARPRHPQTLGKDERFHRSLQAEVIASTNFQDLSDCQQHFDRWRTIYNFERPHEALGLAVPASSYSLSNREYPEPLPPIEYGPEALVRKVQAKGEISFRNRVFKIGRAFQGYPVALYPTTTDGTFDVFFCHQKVAQINLKEYNNQP